MIGDVVLFGRVQDGREGLKRRVPVKSGYVLTNTARRACGDH